MSFAQTINPVLVSLGPLAIRWYSLVYVAGFILAYYLLIMAAKKGWVKNFSKDGAEELTIALIIGSIVTARLFYCIVYNPAYYLANPLHVLYVWRGGLSFHGGFLGAIIVGLWFTKKYKVSFWQLADLLVLPFSLALVFGRFANFVNSELPGRVTNVAWCVKYPREQSITGCRHPSQFYEAGKNVLVFLVLLAGYTRDAFRKKVFDGFFFWSFTVLYGLGRFLTDFYRAPDPTDPVWGGLLLGQWLSLAMVVVALPVLVLLWRKQKNVLAAEEHRETWQRKSESGRKKSRSKSQSTKTTKKKLKRKTSTGKGRQRHK